MTQYLFSTYPVKATVLERSSLKKLIIFTVRQSPHWHGAGSGPCCRAFLPQRRAHTPKNSKAGRLGKQVVPELGFWEMNLKGRLRKSTLRTCSNELSPWNRCPRNSGWAGRTLRDCPGVVRGQICIQIGQYLLHLNTVLELYFFVYFPQTCVSGQHRCTQIN